MSFSLKPIYLRLSFSCSHENCSNSCEPILKNNDLFGCLSIQYVSAGSDFCFILRKTCVVYFFEPLKSIRFPAFSYRLFLTLPENWETKLAFSYSRPYNLPLKPQTLNLDSRHVLNGTSLCSSNRSTSWLLRRSHKAEKIHCK